MMRRMALTTNSLLRTTTSTCVRTVNRTQILRTNGNTIRPVAYFSSTPDAAVPPVDATVPLNPPTVLPINARYPNGKSITQLVLDVLKTGPKTRKQIFYALNRGPPAPLPPVKPKAKPLPWAINKNAQEVIIEAPHAYPTGILRNPTHLSVILRMLLRGKRCKAVPLANVAGRMGEQEKNSLDEIVQSNPYSANLLASNTVRGTDGKISEPWAYVLRDWSDPAFAAKGAVKIPARAAKMERQRLRKEAAIAAANEQGIKLPLGRPVQDSRRVRHKKEVARLKADYEARVGDATAAYRVAVMDDKTAGQPSKLGGDAVEKQAVLNEIIARRLQVEETLRGQLTADDRHEIEQKVRSSAYKYMIHDTESTWLIKLRTENPKIREEGIKEMIRRRNKVMQLLAGVDQQKEQ